MKSAFPLHRRQHVVLAMALVVPSVALAGFHLVDDLPPPATLAARADSSARDGIPPSAFAGTLPEMQRGQLAATPAGGGGTHLEAIEARLVQVEAEIRRLTRERDDTLTAYAARYGKPVARASGEGEPLTDASPRMVVPNDDTALMTVRFALGSRDFRPESQTARALLDSAQRSLRIVIHGYTDASGAPAATASFSAARAWAARAFFLQHGIAAARISATGVKDGYAFPHTTEVGRAANRRVEIRFYSDTSTNLSRSVTQVTR